MKKNNSDQAVSDSRMSRRGFIKIAGAAAAGLALNKDAASAANRQVSPRELQKAAATLADKNIKWGVY